MWVLSIGCQRGRFDNLVDRLMVDESIQIAVEGILFLLLLFSSLLIGHWSLLILILDLHIQFVVEQVLQDLIIVGASFSLDRKPARLRLRCCTH
jgi:hypothetical protein